MPTINDMPPGPLGIVALMAVLVIGAVILGLIFRWTRDAHNRKDEP